MSGKGEERIRNVRIAMNRKKRKKSCNEERYLFLQIIVKYKRKIGADK